MLRSLDVGQIKIEIKISNGRPIVSLTRATQLSTNNIGDPLYRQVTCKTSPVLLLLLFDVDGGLVFVVIAVVNGC